MPPKRKAAPVVEPITADHRGPEDVDVAEEQAQTPSAKKRRLQDNAPENKFPQNRATLQPTPDFTDRTRYKDSKTLEENGIILRKYYPPEMSLERANKYATGEIERPITLLERRLQETRAQRDAVEIGESVVFWFKNDLRSVDNRGLWMAAEKARSTGTSLICVYLVSPQDFEAHLTAAVRVDFILRNLRALKERLVGLDIPLYVEVTTKRRMVGQRLLELCEQWGAKHLFCNMEYEVDELRREAALVSKGLERGTDVEVVHDTCVVEPGRIVGGKGGMISVFSPWHRKWCKYVNENQDVLKVYAEPGRNPERARKRFGKLFESEIPEEVKGKALPREDAERYRRLWPVGQDEAFNRLQKFLNERVKNYHNARNLPAGDHTSNLSAHLAAGTIAARTVIREALKSSSRKTISDDRQQGHMMWIGEVAWRDFYKHVLCAWPYVCMSIPFKPEYNNIEWEYNDEHFHRWTEGRTGFPIVDAAMRQCNYMGYMHNRCRMIVASFLAKDLMIDWRMGERWFMEHLIDGDFASNNGGWGFSASCGVDPQPYFRIFNPLLQSEKFDESGEYIRKWVPELRDVKGKAVHDPYGRGEGSTARKNGYPQPIVVHKECRERALRRYKEGLGRSTA